MSLSPLICVGSGGHAKVVIEIARAEGTFDVIGCTDPVNREPVLGVSVIGNDNELDRLWRQGIRHVVVALGANRTRLRIGRSLRERGFVVPVLVHPSATVSPTARLGSGTVVMPGAVVNAEAAIGEFAILNTLSSVDHDCVLGDGVHVGPRSVLAGAVRLGEGVFLGAGAVAIPGVSIGAYTTVGAGGVVVSDLEAQVTAVGVPARVLAR